MAGASLLTLIDDIATILDDVSVMTKVAAKKTAGVLGDDLALNAQQVAGVNADRELPVVWAVAKGSAINKLILVPTALAISAFAPWAVTPLLMLGGLFLCFEGVEKLYHKHTHEEAETPKTVIGEDQSPAVETSEKEKIKGAIRTDFVLSAEIIVITLGTVATAAFTQQIVVLVGIAAIMTVGVYGLVAGIVKLDDGGLYLSVSKGKSVFAQLKRKLGFAILAFAPYMMKTLSVVGTAAMFLVGGAILAHGIPAVHHWIEHVGGTLNNGFLAAIVPALLNGLLGVVAGALALMVFNLGKRLFSKKSAAPAAH
jgi:predicted DNA repair protein MutK